MKKKFDISKINKKEFDLKYCCINNAKSEYNIKFFKNSEVDFKELSIFLYTKPNINSTNITYNGGFHPFQKNNSTVFYSYNTNMNKTENNGINIFKFICEYKQNGVKNIAHLSYKEHKKFLVKDLIEYPQEVVKQNYEKLPNNIKKFFSNIEFLTTHIRNDIFNKDENKGTEFEEKFPILPHTPVLTKKGWYIFDFDMFIPKDKFVIELPNNILNMTKILIFDKNGFEVITNYKDEIERKEYKYEDYEIETEFIKFSKINKTYAKHYSPRISNKREFLFYKVGILASNDKDFTDKHDLKIVKDLDGKKAIFLNNDNALNNFHKRFEYEDLEYKKSDKDNLIVIAKKSKNKNDSLEKKEDIISRLVSSKKLKEDINIYFEDNFIQLQNKLFELENSIKKVINSNYSNVNGSLVVQTENNDLILINPMKETTKILEKNAQNIKVLEKNHKIPFVMKKHQKKMILIKTDRNIFQIDKMGNVDKTKSRTDTINFYLNEKDIEIQKDSKKDKLIFNIENLKEQNDSFYIDIEKERLISSWTESKNKLTKLPIKINFNKEIVNDNENKEKDSTKEIDKMEYSLSLDEKSDDHIIPEELLSNNNLYENSDLSDVKSIVMKNYACFIYKENNKKIIFSQGKNSINFSTSAGFRKQPKNILILKNISIFVFNNKLKIYFNDNEKIIYEKDINENKTKKLPLNIYSDITKDIFVSGLNEPINLNENYLKKFDKLQDLTFEKAVQLFSNEKKIYNQLVEETEENNIFNTIDLF